MRIVHYTVSMRIGGISRLVLDLMQAQQSEGLHPSLLLNEATGNFMPETEVFSVFETNLRRGFSCNLSRLRQVAAWVNKNDLLHIHFYNPVVHLLVQFVKIPVVYTMHGLSKPFRHQSSIKKAGFEYAKKRFLNRHIDFFVANSQFTLSEAKHDYGLQRVPQKHILNGVQLKKNSEAVTGTEKWQRQISGRFTIGLVSNFTNRKRIDRLIQAFSQLPRPQIGRNCLLLVGDGTEMQNLRQLVAKLTLNKHVIFAGHQPTINRFYNLMDVVVFPATQEPFGLVAVEAYSHGKPVIVFEDGGGLLEIVQPFAPEDVVKNPDYLAKRLEYYFANRQNISEAEELRIEHAKKFSVERMEAAYREVYQKLI